MPIVCEDLTAYGVALIAAPDPAYECMVRDILERLGRPAVDGPTVVLRNDASRAIASVAYIWRFRRGNNKEGTFCVSPGTNPSVVLPFQLNQGTRKFNSYWHTILPGSKRLLRFNGGWLGDNTDVRPPEPDELWKGGFFSPGGGINEWDESEVLRLTLDGVFFEDGGFAGPNQVKSWEQTVSAAETYVALGALGREAQRLHMSAASFFSKVADVTGQTEEGKLLPPLPGLPQDGERLGKLARAMVGFHILRMRERLSDDQVMAHVADWSNVSVPRFHKLA